MGVINAGDAAQAMRDRIRKFGQMFNDAGYRGQQLNTESKRKELEGKDTQSSKE